MSPAPHRRRQRRRQQVSPQRTRILLATALALLGLAFGIGLAPSAQAHVRSVSYSSWEIGAGTIRVTVRLKLLELSRLGPNALSPGILAGRDETNGSDPLAAMFPEDLVLIADGKRCTPDAVAKRRSDEPGWVQYQWQIECPRDAVSLEIRTRILLDVAPSHMHFARVHFNDEQSRIREQVLTEAAPSFNLRRSDGDDSESTANDAIGSRFIDYLALGIDHILTGWDHLAFVFGLLLLAGRLGEVARLITGFTLAHSLTLALAVQGLVHPRAAAVEAIIAFSVALVAVEKGWLLSGRNRVVPLVAVTAVGALGLASMLGLSSLPILTIIGLLIFTACYFALASKSRSEWLRICLTFAFGLVHGFGFAGILVEMTLPTDRLVPALLGFNLGVEIGQIGVVLLIWPILVLATRLTSHRASQVAGELSAAALCGLGVYWLVERAFSL